jgi:hypothetical protein
MFIKSQHHNVPRDPIPTEGITKGTNSLRVFFNDLLGAELDTPLSCHPAVGELARNALMDTIDSRQRVPGALAAGEPVSSELQEDDVFTPAEDA